MVSNRPLQSPLTRPRCENSATTKPTPSWLTSCKLTIHNHNFSKRQKKQLHLKIHPPWRQALDCGDLSGERSNYPFVQFHQLPRKELLSKGSISATVRRRGTWPRWMWLRRRNGSSMGIGGRSTPLRSGRENRLSLTKQKRSQQWKRRRRPSRCRLNGRCLWPWNLLRKDSRLPMARFRAKSLSFTRQSMDSVLKIRQEIGISSWNMKMRRCEELLLWISTYPTAFKVAVSAGRNYRSRIIIVERVRLLKSHRCGSRLGVCRREKREEPCYCISSTRMPKNRMKRVRNRNRERN